MSSHLKSMLLLARRKSGLSVRHAARLAGTSHATLIAYEKGRKSPSLDTFERILSAWNYQPVLELQTRIRQRAGRSRDQELIAALQLAEQFPSYRARKLVYPKFPTRV